MLMTLGAYCDISPRGAGSTSSILPRMNIRPSCACASALRMISRVMPFTLMSIWIAVTPSAVPATLKSMSPR